MIDEDKTPDESRKKLKAHMVHVVGIGVAAHAAVLHLCAMGIEAVAIAVEYEEYMAKVKKVGELPQNPPNTNRITHEDIERLTLRLSPPPVEKLSSFFRESPKRRYNKRKYYGNR